MLIDKIQRKDTMCVCVLSHVQLYVTQQTVTHQTPLSMGFSRQEYWSGSPFPTPRDLPNSGIEPVSLASPALAGRLFNSAKGRDKIRMLECDDAKLHVQCRSQVTQ